MGSPSDGRDAPAEQKPAPVREDPPTGAGGHPPPQGAVTAQPGEPPTQPDGGTGGRAYEADDAARPADMFIQHTRPREKERPE